METVPKQGKIRWNYKTACFRQLECHKPYLYLCEQQNTSDKRLLNVVKGYLVEVEKDKFPGPDPSALLLLSRHFRTHPLHNYLVFSLYGFSSSPFSSRMLFFCRCLFWNCLHSAMLHDNMCFILIDFFRLRFHDGCGSTRTRPSG